MTREHLVYLMGHEVGDVLARPVKCGISQTPWTRIGALQTGSALKLGMLAIFHIETRQAALEVEREFHARAAAFRMEGEWFDLAPREAVVCLCDCIAAYYASRLRGRALYQRLVESGAIRAYERAKPTDQEETTQ